MTTPFTIRVKIGTLSADYYRLVMRRPKRHVVPALRRAPKVGECFYVAERWSTVLLRCTAIKPELGPLYYAERA